MRDHVEDLYYALAGCNADKKQTLDYLVCMDNAKTMDDVNACLQRLREAAAQQPKQ